MILWMLTLLSRGVIRLALVDLGSAARTGLVCCSMDWVESIVVIEVTVVVRVVPVDARVIRVAIRELTVVVLFHFRVAVVTMLRMRVKFSAGYRVLRVRRAAVSCFTCMWTWATLVRQ